MQYKRAEVRWNGDEGALLCNGCGVIIAYGMDHVDCEYFCMECTKDIEVGRVPRKPEVGRPDLIVGEDE